MSAEQFVEWVEPFCGSEPVYMRVSTATAIAHQKLAAEQARPGFKYENDEQALNDFIACHWAKALSAQPDTGKEDGERLQINPQLAELLVDALHESENVLCVGDGRSTEDRDKWLLRRVVFTTLGLPMPSLLDTARAAQSAPNGGRGEG
jgi:hypothetical protein